MKIPLCTHEFMHVSMKLQNMLFISMLEVENLASTPNFE